MKQFFKLFLLPLFIGMLIQVFALILRLIFTKDSANTDATNFFIDIPFYYYIISTICLALIAFVIIKLSAQKKNTPLGIYKSLAGTLIDIATLKHEGVFWKIKIPVYKPTDRIFPNVRLDEIQVEIPPRCPICKCELEETNGVIRKYVWKCPNKDYKKRSGKSFYDIEPTVKKISRRELEKDIQNNPKFYKNPDSIY